jgi:hypothetical protein
MWLMSEYILKTIKNEDFLISDIKHANILIIKYTDMGNVLEFRNRNDANIQFKIPIRNIETVEITQQDTGWIKKTKDKIIQITFKDEQGQTRIIRLNPEDNYVEDIQKELIQLRREEFNKDSKYW